VRRTVYLDVCCLKRASGSCFRRLTRSRASRTRSEWSRWAVPGGRPRGPAGQGSKTARGVARRPAAAWGSPPRPRVCRLRQARLDRTVDRARPDRRQDRARVTTPCRPS